MADSTVTVQAPTSPGFWSTVGGDLSAAYHYVAASTIVQTGKATAEAVASLPLKVISGVNNAIDQTSFIISLIPWIILGIILFVGYFLFKNPSLLRFKVG